MNRLDDKHLYPVGYIEQYVSPHDFTQTVRLRQMTVDGWKFISDSNRVVQLSPEQMPSSEPWRGLPSIPPHPHTIGRTTRVRRDDFGITADFKLNDFFTAELKKAMVNTDDLLLALGLDDPKLKPFATDMDLFPDITAPRGGIRWHNLPKSKENSMTAQKLKTPSKNIKRKDLSVAMRLNGTARQQDELYDIIALVQSVADNETIYCVSELKEGQLVGKNVRVHGIDASGVCSDFHVDEYSGKYNLVLAGKLEQLASSRFVIVSEIETSLGDDALKLVQD
jgi:hypothetical protein